MASVNSATGSPSDIYAAIGGKPAASDKAGADAIQDRFLTLLVAQLKNQDPLNPTDNAQLTSQMSQISTVTGLEKLNGTLSELFNVYDTGQAMQAAGMIGKGVLVPGNKLGLVEGVAVAGVDLEASAGNVKISVKDATGKTVYTEDLGNRTAGSFAFVWDGTMDSGEKAADGMYTFSIEAASDGKAVAAKALQAGTVNAVVRGTSGFTLDLGVLGQVSFADVKQIL